MRARPNRTALFAAIFELQSLERRQLLSAGAESAHELPDWMSGLYAPAINNLTRPGSYLSAPSVREAGRIASDFLMAERFNVNTRGADWESAIVTNQYQDASNGLTYIYYRQQYQGREVLNANANVSVDRQGRVLSAASSFVRGPASANRRATMSAKEVMIGLADELEITSIGKISTRTLADGSVQISAPNFSSKPIHARLVYVAQQDSSMELSWQMTFDLPNQEHWYELAASASTGKVVFATDYVQHATYLALDSNAASPYDGGQITLTDPQNPTASPYGWHDTNGVAGAEYQVTRGNNVFAYLDIDNNDSPDTGSSGQSVPPPEGGPSLNFIYPADFTLDPGLNSNQRAAAVNLFVQNNYIHDVIYDFGFTESAGNFQTNNYGRGGDDGDEVRAEAQDGGGNNNANFASPPDGQNPRMQMYIWTNANPDRDADFDNQIIYHEYGHGISTRLTGGPNNSSSLDLYQSGSMGEGWSDFFAIVLTAQPTDLPGTPIGMSPWAINESVNGNGIRTYAYSTDFNVNPFTADSINDSGGSYHYGGSVWNTALWEMYWELTSAYGFDNNFYGGWQQGGSGNKLALRLVTDAMKIQPANPRYSDARDAILQADLNLTGGANQTLIWKAFARRGFGYSMDSGVNADASNIVEAFDVPAQIGGTVFNDGNDNGEINPGEAPLANVRVYLDSNNNSQFDTGEPNLFTDEEGGYAFNGLPNGNYNARVALNGYRTTSPTNGVQAVAVSGASAVNVNRNFAMTNLARVQGVVYDDYNANQQRNTGESGVAGVRVFADINNNGLFESTDVNQTNDTVLFLPDLTTINSPITVTGAGGTITNLTVYVSLTQTYLGDLDIWLISPNGTRVELATDLGGSRNGMNVTFSDAAGTSATSWPTNNGSAINGTYRPEGSLSVLNGQSINGTWNLEITDDEPNDTGSLLTWSIIGNSAEPSALSAADGTYVMRAMNSGTYNIRRQAPVAPWIPTTPLTNLYPNVALSAAQLVDLSFGQRNGSLPAQLAQSFAFETTTPRLFVTFSESVNVPPGSFSVINTDTNQPVNATATFNIPTQTATITFPDGVLPDGRYRLTTTTSINDGTNPLVNPQSFNFNWLRGDFNLNGSVDFNDLLVVAQHYGINGATYSTGDLNWDGLVNFNDLLAMAQRYGNVLVNGISQSHPFSETSISDEVLT